MCALILHNLKRLSASFLQAVLPTRCYQCNQLYHPRRAFEKWHPDIEGLCAEFLCPACQVDFKPIRPPLCLTCGIPFEGRHGPDHLCGACEKEPPHFQKARSTGAYEGALRCMIHWLKYRGHAQVAKSLGRLLWGTFQQHWSPEEIDVIVPVPLHARRLRKRGFNQAFQLVRKWPELAARQGLKWNADRIAPELLRRCRPTDSQTGLDRMQRRSNLERAITLSGNARVHGLNVLLIDDVLTTGTTADQCAGVLLSAGARTVHVLTLARTI